MGQAYFYTGFIELKNGLTHAPIIYDETWSATKPPFTYEVIRNCKYMSYDIRINNPNINIIALNINSPLFVAQNGAFVGKWLEAYNDPNMSEKTVVVFKNDNYITAQRQSNNTMTIRGYNSSSTLAGNITIGVTSDAYVAISAYKADDNEVFLNMCRIHDLNGARYELWLSGLFTLINGFNILSNAVVDTEDPYFFSDDSRPNGGFGDFDYSGDEIDFDALPTISVADSGFVTLFNPTEGQLKSLAQYMWSGLFDIATFRKIFADPMDCIIGLSIVPVTPPTGSAKELKVGNIGTGLTFNPLSSQFVEVDFNPLNIGLRTNSFMDFAPYTKCQIYLPFCGTFSLSVDDVCDADLILKYKIDLFTGACTASIKVVKTNSDGAQLKSVLYQFSGNVSANVPFTSTNYNGFLQGILGTVGAVAGIATGGAGITAAGAVSAINGAMSMKPEIERSGNLAATSGFLGKQKPYLIMQYPHLCKPYGRDKTVGTPSFIGLSASKKLNSYHGLTSLHKVNVKGIPCTEDERVMIESALLTEGVILP